MADNKPQAKNELGQLFVDIGIGGLGKTLKGLNSVAATFLLGKNAAMQFANTLTQPFKEAGNAAVGIGKMSNALATSSMEFQKLSMYLKKYNLSEDLLGDISKLQKETYNWADGTLNITGEVGRAFGELKLNYNDYKGSFKDTLRLLDHIQERTSNMSKEKRNQILDFLGLNNDWGYLWDKGGRAGDYYTISDDAIKANQSLAEAMSGLKNTMDNLWQEALSKMAPAITSIAKHLDEWAKNWANSGGIDNTANAITNMANVSPTVGGKIVDAVFPIVGIGKRINAGIKGYNGATGGAAPVIDSGDGLPTGYAANTTQSITNNITHNNTINGDNANEIANQIAGISAQDIQYTQYQANNLAGI